MDWRIGMDGFILVGAKGKKKREKNASGNVCMN